MRRQKQFKPSQEMAVQKKRRCPAVFSQCLLRSAPRGALGRAVLVAQAGAAPVQPKLLPVGFPLAHRALLVCRRDAQSRSLAPAAQAGLRGDKQGGGLWDKRGGNVGKFPVMLVGQPTQCRAGSHRHGERGSPAGQVCRDRAGADWKWR